MRLIDTLKDGWVDGVQERGKALNVIAENDWIGARSPFSSSNIPDIIATQASPLHPLISAMGHVRNAYRLHMQGLDFEPSEAIDMFSPSALGPTTARHCATIAHHLGSGKKEM